MIRVFDANGREKRKGFNGIVTVPHGGTGLSTVTQGDLLISDATASLTSLPVDTSGLIKVVSNQGTSNAPTWQTYDVNSASFGTLSQVMFRRNKQPGSFFYDVGTGASGGDNLRAWGMPTSTFLITIAGSGGGTLSSTLMDDARGAFNRSTVSTATTGSGGTGVQCCGMGTVSGAALLANAGWLDHEIFYLARFRTGTSVANNAAAGLNTRYEMWSGIFQTMPTVAGVCPKGVGFRWWNGVDTVGMRTITFDGTTETADDQLLPINVSSEYVLSLNVYGDGSATYTMRNITSGDARTVTKPAGWVGSGAFGAACGVLGVLLIPPTNTRVLDLFNYAYETGQMS